jgi:hypothetical protein
MSLLTALNPVSKWLGVAVVALVLILSAVLYGANEQRKRLGDTEVALAATTAQLLASKEQLVLVQKSVARESARADANKRLLRNALKENAEWAAGRVPKSVADSLCKRGLCARDPAPAVPKALN